MTRARPLPSCWNLLKLGTLVLHFSLTSAMEEAASAALSALVFSLPFTRKLETDGNTTVTADGVNSSARDRELGRGAVDHNHLAHVIAGDVVVASQLGQQLAVLL